MPIAAATLAVTLGCKDEELLLAGGGLFLGYLALSRVFHLKMLFPSKQDRADLDYIQRQQRALRRANGGKLSGEVLAKTHKRYQEKRKREGR